MFFRASLPEAGGRTWGDAAVIFGYRQRIGFRVQHSKGLEMRFRIRSSARDESTDAYRLGSIERSVLRAIGDAEKEKKGLNRRLERAKASASALLGNDTFEYRDRKRENEQVLAEAEHNLIAAERRIRQLNAHLERLHRVLDLLKQK